MACRQFINAVNTSAQTMTANSFVEFSQVVSKVGECIKFNAVNTIFNLPCSGTYAISFDADVGPTTTGEVELLIVNNGTAIPGAASTATATATDITHMHCAGSVTVLPSCKCISNAGNIQVEVTAAGTITNANITIERI